MNRTLDATASLLGQGPRKFRQRLRELGILTQAGELACKHRDKGYLFVQPKQRWNETIKTWSHYSVVMVTEDGVTWLADQLAISIQTETGMPRKDAAA